MAALIICVLWSSLNIFGTHRAQIVLYPSFTLTISYRTDLEIWGNWAQISRICALFEPLDSIFQQFLPSLQISSWPPSSWMPMRPSSPFSYTTITRKIVTTNFTHSTMNFICITSFSEKKANTARSSYLMRDSIALDRLLLNKDWRAEVHLLVCGKEYFNIDALFISIPISHAGLIGWRLK